MEDSKEKQGHSGGDAADNLLLVTNSSHTCIVSPSNADVCELWSPVLGQKRFWEVCGPCLQSDIISLCNPVWCKSLFLGKSSSQEPEKPLCVDLPVCVRQRFTVRHRQQPGHTHTVHLRTQSRFPKCCNKTSPSPPLCGAQSAPAKGPSILLLIKNWVS